MGEFHYVGSELDLFAEARNWKAYWSGRIQSFLSGDVLEVGAGIGSNTELMCRRTTGRWVCLEPDPGLASQLQESLKGKGHNGRFLSVCGTLETLDREENFDTIVYIDVLEHIEDDAAEMREAALRLRPGGRIIVLSPAHQWLYTPFDSSIGHFRRYDRASLKRVSPLGLALEEMFYLDACGIVASAANQLFLRQSMPTRSQIGVWDRWIIPASQVVDPVLRYAVGKSIVGIWRRAAA
ncbi:class I SAM-dependent methyltransferase [Edaphobacter modestus]|uniref:Methyltransferase family protein n=1 Tax=Edaphobacter modestus TaxID=388466 RepID=A0A4Q7Z1D3_9BACT|nr:class I SAM-dependent methyltransferase [Edaphobacter modestus]RZU43353.1 methyltransferase family protein [Edaphobacter modestus]